MHLSDFMAQKGLSDDDVATAIGCTRVSVSRLRRGKLRPSWETTQKIKTFSGGVVTADDWLPMEAAQ